MLTQSHGASCCWCIRERAADGRHSGVRWLRDHRSGRDQPLGVRMGTRDQDLEVLATATPGQQFQHFSLPLVVGQRRCAVELVGVLTEGVRTTSGTLAWVTTGRCCTPVGVPT